MAERVHAQRPAPQQRDEQPAELEQADTADAKAKVDVADELLDEIDALLEDESFVAAYVQKGGQ